MSDWSLDELECAIRTGLRWDKGDTAHLDAGISTGWRLATMQGTTVMMSAGRARRDLEARAKLLETVLGWLHAECSDPFYTCPAATMAREGYENPDRYRKPHKPVTVEDVQACDCGLLDRQRAVLEALAAPYID
jgi:hypothetical protein